MENGMNSLAVFGDSILKGVVTGTGSGKMYDVIQDDSLTLASRVLGFSFQNFSAFGNIITKGCRSLKHKLEGGLSADAVIIESGGNDCDHDWIAMTKDASAGRECRVPLEQFVQTLGEMVSCVRESRMTPVLVSMPPLVHDRWFRTISKNASESVILDFLGGNIMSLYRVHELYNSALVRCAHTHNVQLVDMRSRMLSLDDYEDYMCLDGIHPNGKGYEFMSRVWVEELPCLVREF